MRDLLPETAELPKAVSRFVGAGSSPRRRPSSRLVVALVCLGLLLAGCGSSDSGDSDQGGVPTTSTTTTTASTTSSSSVTTSPTTSTSPVTETTGTSQSTTSAVTGVTADPAHCAEAGSDPANPDPAAQAVFIAWTRGDRACAAELMAPSALDQLFARDGTGATDVFQGCNEVTEPDPAFDCAFTYEGGATHYTMVFSATDGWQVNGIHQVAD